MARTVQGKTNTWQLSDNPIGSGDAGEVFAVLCVDQPEVTGVLKKPARIATGGTLQRQAGQIAQEGHALARLDGLPECKAHPPRLLDQAPDLTTGTANYFIVSETAIGENLADMLNQTRKDNKPFPRRVIITVLDSLFDLFARAHRSGILWNDVKLDHIYWHNPTGGVSVIDWGNAVFLEEKQENQRRALPRWEDYRQLVDTLGGFLQQNAPELYNDLGWYEFQDQELNLTTVSVLARRIAYQQEVIALRVMEFQAMIKVVLTGDPTIDGLKSIQNYQKILEQIGAPWFSPKVLDYTRRLVESQLTEDDRSAAVRTTTMVWDLFGETLNLSWHLLREYFQQTTILSHPRLPELIKFTFAERWSEALWILALIARDQDEEAPWWDRLIPVIRQKALGVATPPPYQIGESIRTWASAQGETSQLGELDKILDIWRTKGEDLTLSPFDYDLLDLVQGNLNLPRKILTELKQTFAAGKEAIRDLFQAWVNPEWDALPKALRRVLGWDPDRWGILYLADVVTEFRAWMQQLYDGPQSNDAVPPFLDKLLAEVPPIDRLLGQAPWLKTMMNALHAIRQGAPVRNFRPAAQAWFPWLLSLENINASRNTESEPDLVKINGILKQFTQHLKTWSDVDSGLALVKTGAPDHFIFCKQLVDGFQSITALTADLDRIKTECAQPTHNILQEACEALRIIVSWRCLVNEGNLDNALDLLNANPKPDWRLLAHAETETVIWKDEINPLLDAMTNTNKSPASVYESENELASAVQAAHEIKRLWETIYTTGLHPRLLDTLQESIETARSSFFKWRHEMETCDDQTRYLLYNYQLNRIRDLSDQLLKLSQHIRQARLSYGTLGQTNDVPIAIQLRNAENLLDHLVSIEDILISEEKELHFPAWQQSFQTVQAAETQNARRETILALTSEHPLYTWLVQSLLAQNNQ